MIGSDFSHTRKSHWKSTINHHSAGGGGGGRSLKYFIQQTFVGRQQWISEVCKPSSRCFLLNWIASSITTTSPSGWRWGPRKSLCHLPHVLRGAGSDSSQGWEVTVLSELSFGRLKKKVGERAVSSVHCARGILKSRGERDEPRQSVAGWERSGLFWRRSWACL